MEIRRCVFGQICDNVIDKGLLLNVKYLLFVVHINPQPPTTVSYFNFMQSWQNFNKPPTKYVFGQTELVALVIFKNILE